MRVLEAYESTKTFRGLQPECLNTEERECCAKMVQPIQLQHLIT